MATITIDLPDQYIPLLTKWASISRTLNSAIKLAELQALEPGLNALHFAVRAQLWKGV